MRINRKLNIFFILMLLLFTNMHEVKAEEYSGSCGENVTYTFNTNTNTLIISGYGLMNDYSDIWCAPWDSQRELIKNVVIENGVTSIGPFAFYYCENLSSITISSSVTNIGDSAFYYCKNLTSITFPLSVTSIGDSAFEFCENLTSITFPLSVTSIGDSAFQLTGCLRCMLHRQLLQ